MKVAGASAFQFAVVNFQIDMTLIESGENGSYMGRGDYERGTL